MAPIRGKLKFRSMRDLALIASISSSDSASSTSQVPPQDSPTTSELCYPPTSAVYEINHNNVLADVVVDEDDDDDNDIYDNQDEQRVLDPAEEQLYAMKTQELAKAKLKLFLSGKLVLDPKKKKKKKKKQIESFGIQHDFYACEEELVSKQNDLQFYKYQKLASSSRRPHKYVYDEDDEDDEEEYNTKKKQRIKASSSRRPHKCVNDQDDEDDEEEYNMKKKQRNKASSSKHPHKSVKNDSNEANNTKNKPKKKIQPIISNEITERLKEHITHQLNGTNIMLVIQKPLFASDLAGSQNRLSMPSNQLETCDFLTEQEKEYLNISTENEIDVPLLGPRLQMFNQPMKLVKWNINSTTSYILRTLWYTFVQENKNDLKQGAMIQVWSYRKEDQNKLCLAIAVVKRAD